MTMDNNFNLGKRIHELRTQQGLSQEQLALRTEITPTYLGLIERNLKNPTVKVIEQLCHALNISLMDFFSCSHDISNSFDSVTNQILAQINNRTSEEKQLILQVIKDVLKLRDFPNRNNT
jgi:transcriptional regulator with XRE-family HTH domain